MSELLQWQQCNYDSPRENKAVIYSCEGIRPADVKVSIQKDSFVKKPDQASQLSFFQIFYIDYYEIMIDLSLRRKNQSAELMSALITLAWWNYIPCLQS